MVSTSASVVAGFGTVTVQPVVAARTASRDRWAQALASGAIASSCKVTNARGRTGDGIRSGTRAVLTDVCLRAAVTVVAGRAVRHGNLLVNAGQRAVYAGYNAFITRFTRGSAARTVGARLTGTLVAIEVGSASGAVQGVSRGRADGFAGPADNRLFLARVEVAAIGASRARDASASAANSAATDRPVLRVAGPTALGGAAGAGGQPVLALGG
jgi:hypothetical protein